MGNTLLQNTYQWSERLSSIFRSSYDSSYKIPSRNPNWVQITGHPDSLLSDGRGNVFKPFDSNEVRCLTELRKDPWLNSYAPDYRGDAVIDGIHYTQMDDLLFTFTTPSIMDCKLGCRTYAHSEVANQHKLRSDMYVKMITVDPKAATSEENELKAVTKLRYMQWRDKLSTSASYGFRVDGVKNAYLTRLEAIRAAIEKSTFFHCHEMIGSSLLFVHDDNGTATQADSFSPPNHQPHVGVWLIDFTKTKLVDIRVDHRLDCWSEIDSPEDGYLTGLDNLITAFRQLSTVNDSSDP